MTLLLLLHPQPPYHQALMNTARANIDAQPAVAVVVAFMACEIVTEQVISITFKERGIEDLEDPVTSLTSGSSLANDRNRRLYTALTRDDIRTQPFWNEFIECAKLRNDAVHAGRRVSEPDARRAVETAYKVLDHLETIRRRLLKDSET